MEICFCHFFTSSLIHSPTDEPTKERTNERTNKSKTFSLHWHVGLHSFVVDCIGVVKVFFTVRWEQEFFFIFLHFYFIWLFTLIVKILNMICLFAYENGRTLKHTLPVGSANKRIFAFRIQRKYCERNAICIFMSIDRHESDGDHSRWFCLLKSNRELLT